MNEKVKDTAVLEDVNTAEEFTKLSEQARRIETTEDIYTAERIETTEDIYTAEEFAQRPDIFGSDVREYTVLAAFRFAEKDRATKTEAQEIVASFRDKKVGE